jgi:magnesium transporter
MAERQILGTAAQHVSTEIPVAAPDDMVADVLDALRRRRFDSAAVIAVCDAGRLRGLVTIERLLVAPPTVRVLDIADRHPPVVAPDTDQEHAAWVALRHGEPGLAVVDADGTFRGLIPPQRLLAVLLEEHDEDLARLGGYLASAATARTASEERVRLRLWHRLPWLLLGLAGALAAAGLIGRFEADLERQVLLAFFVPGVVYMADAVGTQTETLVIRGLSVGVGIRGILTRELVTGLLIGVLLALLTLPVTLAIWGNVGVSLTVSLALLGACSIATLVAMVLPWLFHRLGRDPAFGSGPLATVVQDLLSIAIYLAIARAVLG